MVGETFFYLDYTGQESDFDNTCSKPMFLLTFLKKNSRNFSLPKLYWTRIWRLLQYLSKTGNKNFGSLEIRVGTVSEYTCIFCFGLIWQLKIKGKTCKLIILPDTNHSSTKTQNSKHRNNNDRIWNKKI